MKQSFVSVNVCSANLLKSVFSCFLPKTVVTGIFSPSFILHPVTCFFGREKESTLRYNRKAHQKNVWFSVCCDWRSISTQSNTGHVQNSTSWQDPSWTMGIIRQRPAVSCYVLTKHQIMNTYKKKLIYFPMELKFKGVSSRQFGIQTCSPSHPNHWDIFWIRQKSFCRNPHVCCTFSHWSSPFLLSLPFP